MRSLFGIVGLLVVVAMVGVLAKKQLTSTQQQLPAAAVQGAPSLSVSPDATVKLQSQQIQQQVKQALDAAAQSRSNPEDAEKP